MRFQQLLGDGACDLQRLLNSAALRNQALHVVTSGKVRAFEQLLNAQLNHLLHRISSWRIVGKAAAWIECFGLSTN
jgi:hypothetical protein